MFKQTKRPTPTRRAFTTASPARQPPFLRGAASDAVDGRRGKVVYSSLDMVVVMVRVRRESERGCQVQVTEAPHGRQTGPPRNIYTPRPCEHGG